MSLLRARIKKIQLKMKALECSQDFSHFKSKGSFSRCSRAANLSVHGRIWSNFELFCDFLVVLVVCENDEDLIKNECGRVDTR